jgi:regulatory protein
VGRAGRGAPRFPADAGSPANPASPADAGSPAASASPAGAGCGDEVAAWNAPVVGGQPAEGATSVGAPAVAKAASAKTGAAKASAAEAVDPADPEALARQVCLRLLTAAPRTRAQLATALRRRGVPDQVADTVLERFADVQLIDDAMFARAWVESRHRGRGLARRALAAELRQRGVEAEDIKAAVDGLDPDEEYATARALVERRLPGTRSLAKPVRFRRLMGMLARKGYSQGLAYRVVREALEYEPQDLDTDSHEPGNARTDDLLDAEPDGLSTGW